MNIGNLYLVKKYFWLLYPTKETVTPDIVRSVWHEVPHAVTPIAAAAYDAVAAAYDAYAAAGAAASYSKRFNCEVTYFSPDSLLVCLEEDGVYKKLLTSDGKIGWTWFTENYNDCFEILDFEK